MNRYSWLILVLAAVAMAVYSVMTVSVFSRGMRHQLQESERRMSAFALYAADHVSQQAQEQRALSDGELESWLENLCARTGFERMVIADSLMLVHWSSQPLIRRGDDLGPYLVDTALFRIAAQNEAEQISAPVKIGGAWFRSLYRPFRVGDEQYVMVVEADENYFTTARQFRSSIIVTAAMMGMILVLLSGSVAAVSRRARMAEQRASRNEKLAFLGRASAELAHELKNPLGIIKSSADVLRRTFDSDRQNKAFEFLSEETSRLGRLVDDILSFSREKKLAREPFSPRDAVASSMASLAAQYPGLTMTNNIDPAIRLIGDAGAFVQIASNLLRNAAKATEGQGRIEIHERREGRELCVFFSDNGPGIPPEIASQLFEPFVSGTRTGTGLGLAIVRRLAEAAEWTIELLPRTSNQTSFVLSIPEGLWEKS